jgi:PleD family two-component response regulator
MEAAVDSVVTILLVGDSAPDISLLRNQLRMLGCAVSFVTSCEAALRTLAERKFDLVLAEFLLPDATAYQLLRPLSGTRTTLFFCVSVENDSLWIPILEEGRDRLGSPAVQPARFAKALRDVVVRKRANRREELACSSADVRPINSSALIRKNQPAAAADVSTRYQWEQWGGKEDRQA